MSDIKETLRYKELFEHAAKENGALRANEETYYGLDCRGEGTALQAY